MVSKSGPRGSQNKNFVRCVEALIMVISLWFNRSVINLSIYGLVFMNQSSKMVILKLWCTLCMEARKLFGKVGFYQTRHRRLICVISLEKNRTD